MVVARPGWESPLRFGALDSGHAKIAGKSQTRVLYGVPAITGGRRQGEAQAGKARQGLPVPAAWDLGLGSEGRGGLIDGFAVEMMMGIIGQRQCVAAIIPRSAGKPGSERRRQAGAG